jgi:hypothetical protein
MEKGDISVDPMRKMRAWDRTIIDNQAKRVSKPKREDFMVVWIKEEIECNHRFDFGEKV